jgi:hypothetical protein
MVMKQLIKHYRTLNNSKLLSGLAMLVLNLFSKYVELKISKTQEAYIRNAITREILIFTILFVGTRDIIISILLTAAFVILSNTIFNERSKLCVIPHKYRNLDKVLDTNKDGIISDDEIKKAQDILYKYNIQKNKEAQINNINYFQNNI